MIGQLQFSGSFLGHTEMVGGAPALSKTPESF